MVISKKTKISGGPTFFKGGGGGFQLHIPKETYRT